MVADRAYLKGARAGPGLEKLDALIARVLEALSATGAQRVEPAALQPADVLLDLYGEDIRARAFVTGDDGAELMLRPDFTVPIARLHLDGSRAPARYVYCGPVWRRQEAGSGRAREFLQAGVEIYDDAHPASADAEVLALVAAALGDAPVDLVTGDMGLVLAAIEALDTDPARKTALRRHLWRPARFHALLDRFGTDHAAISAARAPIIAGNPGARVEVAAGEMTLVGLRGMDEIAARIEDLAREAARPPLAQDDVARLNAVLAVTGTCREAAEALETLARTMPELAPAVDRFEARLAAFETRGLDPGRIRFEASFGRTTLEYYDGFVFGAIARHRPDLPPIASGGRYDALTARLGGGGRVPAVGGIVRPEALRALSDSPGEC